MFIKPQCLRNKQDCNWQRIKMVGTKEGRKTIMKEDYEEI